MGQFKNLQLDARTHAKLVRLATRHRRSIKGTVDWLASEQLSREAPLRPHRAAPAESLTEAAEAVEKAA